MSGNGGNVDSRGAAYDHGLPMATREPILDACMEPERLIALVPQTPGTERDIYQIHEDICTRLKERK